jgi:DNA-binding NtrC family response regulator
VAAVLEACGGRTALRPLHERGAEADGIVRAMVDELSADLGRPAPTVSPRFVEAVQALDLPNGLVSLRSILRECLERPSPTLGPDALPARARAGRPPRSGELARSEYDAVVAALAECGGVRSRAARRLGVSRTTLYARMREFGLS